MGKRLKIKDQTYGRDELYANSGPDHPNPGPAYAPNRGYTGSGYKLKKFRGRYLDKRSITFLEDEDAGERTSQDVASDQKFLSKAGFISDGSTLK